MRSPPPERTCARFVLCAALALLALAPLCLLLSSAPAAPQGESAIAKLHKAIADEKHTEAKQQADLMLKSLSADDRLAASLAYGRILLSLGQKDEARQYLAAMKRLTLDANAAQLMEVYQAWLSALDGKPDEAQKTLEQKLVDKRPGSATAEAADVLALLYLRRGDRAGAVRRAVDFGLGFIKYETVQGGKFPGYIEPLLRNRLKVDSGEAFPEAKKLYDQAEKLRQEGKYTEAGKLFVEIRQKWPRSLWNHAAGFRIGQCLVGLRQPQQAAAHWHAFLSGDDATTVGRISNPSHTNPSYTCAPLPWRGQASVALIDLVLSTRVDLKQAGDHARAAVAVLDKGVDEAAKPSWQQAACDIRLRQGIVDLVNGKNEPAAAALRQAKEAAIAAQEKPSDRLLSGLDRLIEAAGGAVLGTGGEGRGPGGEGKKLPSPSGRGAGGEGDRLPSPAGGRGAGGEGLSRLIPEELAIGNEKLAQALAIGTIFNLVGQFEPAAAVFDLVLTGPQRKQLAPQRSFAALGKARALVGLAKMGTGTLPDSSGQPAGVSGGLSPSSRAIPRPFGEGKGEGLALQAKLAYDRSLEESPTATWHEETSREAALLIEELAEQQAAAMAAEQASKPASGAAKPSSPASGKGAGGEGGQKSAAHSRNSRATRPKSSPAEQIRAALVAARAEALPYWVALIEKYPQSRHLPEALYHAGVLYAESPTPDPDKSAAAFERLTREFPKSPWTGDAHVRLIDVLLEQQFDLPAAEKHAQAAVAWLDTVDKAALEKAARPLGASSSLTTDHRPLSTAYYAIYLRAGLIEYLQERCPKALEWFEKAKPFAAARNLVVVQGTIPTGVEKLIALAKHGTFITPQVARQGDPTARLILMLADVYHEGEDWQKSLDLCAKVIAGTGVAAKGTNQQKGWAFFKRGRNYYCLEGDANNPTAAQADYLAAAAAFPKADWADNALFLAANIHWNHHQNADAAVVLWKRLIKSYPQSDEADRAAYFIGVAYQWSGRPQEARQAYEDSLRKFPGSRFNKLIKEQTAKLDAKGDKEK
jgi:tetratricopeptide (TPR) repeat protein